MTPLGSSTPSTRGGSTPFFTSPKGSGVNLNATPFASLSECPFTETDGPSASEAQSIPQAKAQQQRQQQPAEIEPPVRSSSEQVEAMYESQVCINNSQ